jgi:excisionase family DNA binding protein
VTAWQAWVMPENATDIQLIAIPEAAEALGVSVSRVHRFIRDGALVAVRDDEGRRIPAAFLQNGVVVKGMSGVVTLLRDGGYQDHEIVDWLFRADDSLPGTPIQALRENRGTEVKRRAQIAGF